MSGTIIHDLPVTVRVKNYEFALSIADARALMAQISGALTALAVQCPTCCCHLLPGDPCFFCLGRSNEIQEAL